MYQEARKESMLHSNSSVSGKVSQAAGRTSMVTHQFKASDFRPIENIQRKKNNTGLSDQLKSGIESMSGYSMDDVKVHFNSSKPAMVQAHAYTSGTDIHVAPGQEKHLAHEAWHVVQQKQGRVQPTTTVNGMSVNDNAGLEHEADVMGAKALQCKSVEGELKDGGRGGGVVQREKNEFEDGGTKYWVHTSDNEGIYLCSGEDECIKKAKEIANLETSDVYRYHKDQNMSTLWPSIKWKNISKEEKDRVKKMRQENIGGTISGDIKDYEIDQEYLLDFKEEVNSLIEEISGFNSAESVNKKGGKINYEEVLKEFNDNLKKELSDKGKKKKGEVILNCLPKSGGERLHDRYVELLLEKAKEQDKNMKAEVERGKFIKDIEKCEEARKDDKELKPVIDGYVLKHTQPGFRIGKGNDVIIEKSGICHYHAVNNEYGNIKNAYDQSKRWEYDDRIRGIVVQFLYYIDKCVTDQLFKGDGKSGNHIFDKNVIIKEIKSVEGIAKDK